MFRNLSFASGALKSSKNALQGSPWWSRGWVSGLPVQGVWVRTLVRELRSHMPCVHPKTSKQKLCILFYLLVQEVGCGNDGDSILQSRLCVWTLSCVWFFATPWTIALHAPLSMGFSRQEYFCGLPFPSPGDLPDPGIKSRSPTLQADSLPSELPGKYSDFKA